MERRSSIVGGLILILLGILFLVLQAFPGIAAQIDLAAQWPLIIVSVGGFFLLGALLGTPPLAVPGAVITGLGIMFYYQNLTGSWDSWIYAWTLIPGFVGVGIMLMSLLSREARSEFRSGLRLVVISGVLFLVFGGLLGDFGGIGRFWPVLIIALGILLILRGRSGSGSAGTTKKSA